MADFLLIGGDARQRHLAKLLRQDGHRVRTYGVAADPQDMVEEADAIVCLPVPSFRGGKVPGEFGTALAAKKALARVTGQHCFVYATPEEENRIAAMQPATLTNLARDEVFLQDNAELTAEGAILAASSDMGRSLWRSRCLILGYGRIGKALHTRLAALGAQVAVAARAKAARDLARENGACVSDFASIPEGADFVFNTVPEQVLSPELLARIVGRGLYVELASAPYGISAQDADQYGLRSQFLPGIPGKFFPYSAAVCIRDAYFRSDLPEILS